MTFQTADNIIPFIFRAKTFEELVNYYSDNKPIKEVKQEAVKVHHSGFRTDSENDRLILDIVQKVNPDYSVIFPTNKFSPWDAKVVDQQGNVKLYIESKIRFKSSKSYHSMFVDGVKNKLKSYDAPIFILQKFSDGAIYLYKLFEDGEVNPLVSIEDRACQTSQWNQSYKQKKIYLMWFMDCWKYEYRNEKLVLVQAPNKQRAEKAIALRKEQAELMAA